MPSIPKNLAALTVAAIQTQQGVNQSLFFSNELNDARQRYAKKHKKVVKTAPQSQLDDATMRAIRPATYWQCTESNIRVESALDYTFCLQGQLFGNMQRIEFMEHRKNDRRHEKHLGALLKKCLMILSSQEAKSLASDPIKIDFVDQPDNRFLLSIEGNAYRLQLSSSAPDFISTAIKQKKTFEQRFCQHLSNKIIVDIQRTL